MTSEIDCCKKRYFEPAREKAFESAYRSINTSRSATNSALSDNNDYFNLQKNVFSSSLFVDAGPLAILHVIDRIRSRNHTQTRTRTMKRIFSVLIASAALFAAASGVAHADAPASTCNGPASYCNVFFGN
ncbi:hypothetical protein F0160_07315 [Paraburkholderia sp. JPY303]|uniref:Uncharacterized protein n=2 Tax=Paraburkholderia atlantica TaxID=2654982 RepID=A0A7W8Q419_PARAM|nr:hypothetical protein [Paraburkholderia atlantica]MBB5422849.1 hypothetical protein [Paraburkholderia atlantica]NUY30327.1 hypothetical protein [Paraburkholderia atlantica]